MEGLTDGAIAAVSNGEVQFQPAVQVLDIRLIGTGQSTQERYRMLLSDGTHMHQAMLATQLNHFVNSGKLQIGSIVKLTEFVCNTIQKRRIIIVINLEVVVEKCNIIGEPKHYPEGNASGPAAPQARSSMPAQSSTMCQPGPAAGNPQSYGRSHPSGPQMAQSVNSGVPMYPKPEPATGHSGSSPSARNYSDPPQNLAKHNQNLSNPGGAGAPNPPFNTYGRPVAQPTHQPPPMYMNRGPVARNEAPARIIPINALNPYQGRWTIKARVTGKGDLRRYNNPRGEGKVFSFDLLDSDGGEIRVTCFNTVADQFYGQIEVGKVYLISKGILKPAQKNFNHLNNEWEISLESTSTIEPCLEEDNSIPKQQFSFRPISDVEGMESNSMVDLIGIVGSIIPSSTILRKNGTETEKRTLQLKDMSGRSVELTLWGNFCNTDGQQLQDMCDSGVFPVLAIKAGRVNEFNGKSVGTISTSQLFINPDFPEAHRLREWFNREGKSTVVLSISRDTSAMGRPDIRKTVSQIKDEGLGKAEKPDWITVKATISFIKSDNFCYTACPLMLGDRQCNKKVNNNGDGMWHCERCDRSFPECDYRYLLQVQIQDWTGLTWVTAFQEAGEEIMSISAKELYLLKHEEQDDIRVGEILRKVLFNQFLFKLKVKEETYSDEQRVKSTVVKVERLNFSSEAKYLAGLIEKLSVENTNVVPGFTANFGSDSGLYQPTSSNLGINYGRNPVGNNLVNNTDRYGVPSVNQTGQYMNESGGFGGHSAGSTVVHPFCNKCGSAGHNPQNCPKVTYGHGHSIEGFSTRLSNAGADIGGASDRCYKCNQGGHWAKDCPGPGAIPSTYGTSGVVGRFGMQSNSYGGGF